MFRTFWDDEHTQIDWLGAWSSGQQRTGRVAGLVVVWRLCFAMSFMGIDDLLYGSDGSCTLFNQEHAPLRKARHCNRREYEVCTRDLRRALIWLTGLPRNVQPAVGPGLLVQDEEHRKAPRKKPDLPDPLCGAGSAIHCSLIA
jgi:hypothetical protein